MARPDIMAGMQRRGADINDEEWRSLLAPYTQGRIDDATLSALQSYLDLLLRWNGRMNLTAVRDPRAIIARHFGESLLAARYVPRGTSSLLDHGSGAGFPGVPIAIARPEVGVTVSEGHGRKAAFLRELSRTLKLQNLQVHGGRSESLDSQFEVVTMRAVDEPDAAFLVAKARLSAGGVLLVLESADGLTNEEPIAERPIPNSTGFLRTYNWE